MTMVLGHRGYSAKYLENSMQAFVGALDAGMDGFELDVQPTRDSVCIVLHDRSLRRTAESGGILRRLSSADLPRLRNGEPIPCLDDALRLPAALVNVELKGRPGWRVALDAVQRGGALDRVIFSSFEHEEVFELRSSCERARCGLLWEARQAARLTRDLLSRIPDDFTLHLPIDLVAARPEFWAPHGARLAVWGMKKASESEMLPFSPAIVIADAP